MSIDPKALNPLPLNVCFVEKPSILRDTSQAAWFEARDDIGLLLMTTTHHDWIASKSIATAVMERLSILQAQQDNGL